MTTHSDQTKVSIAADQPPAEPVTCPECDGTGKSGLVPAFSKTVDGHKMTAAEAHKLAEIVAVCQFCDGHGTVAAERLEWRSIGQQWRLVRIKRGVGLREWAESVGCLPSNYCNMENGRLKPDERYSPLADQPPAEPAVVELPDGPGVWFRDGKQWIVTDYGNGPLMAAPLDAHGKFGGFYARTIDRVERGHWRKAVPSGREVEQLQFDNDLMRPQLRVLAGQLKAIEHDRNALVAALQPFADLCDGDLSNVGDGTALGFDGRLTAGMIKRAKAALSPAQETPHE